MAKFDIPESPKFNYMDLNNLQGIDSWDTNQSPMRASDSLNMVKKEGLHQVRHNVDQKWSINYSPTKNLIQDMVYEFNDENGYSKIYMDCELDTETRYVISFYKTELQNFLLNENLFDIEENISTQDKEAYIVTTKSVLDNSNYVEGKGWLCFETNETTSVIKSINNVDRLLKGSIINFEKLLNLDLSNYNTEGYLIQDLLSTQALYNSLNEQYGLKIYYGNSLIYEYENPNIENSTINNVNYLDNEQFDSVRIDENTWVNPYVSMDVSKKYKETSGYAEADITYLIKVTNPVESTNIANFQKVTLYITPFTIKDGIKTYYSTTYRRGSRTGTTLYRGESLSVNPTVTWRFNESYDFDEYGFEFTSSVTIDDQEYTQDFTKTIIFDNEFTRPSQDATKELYISHLNVNNTELINVINKTSEILQNIDVETNNFENNIYSGNVQENNATAEYIRNGGEDDLNLPIKYIGKIEEYDEMGNTVPYYIKISEYLGERDVENDSKLIISVWPSPLVKNITYDLTLEQGYEKYKIGYKIFNFTNYGESGNRQGFYEHIEFDGKERVFTPIGILSFKCFTTDIEGGYKQLGFDVENVLDNPYVPTVVYGSKPDGTDASKYEAINLLSDKRKAQFLADGTSTVFVLPEKKLDDYCKVSIMNEYGLFEEVTEGYTFNHTLGKVTFNTAPSKSPIEGKDNILIEYSKKPIVDNEDNIFTLTSQSSDKMVNATIDVEKSTNTSDDTKIDVSLDINITTGSSFDATTTTYNSVSFNVLIGTEQIYTYKLTSSELSTLKSSGSLHKTASVTIDNTTSVRSRNWVLKINDTYNQNTTKTVTTKQAGSKGSNTSFGTVSQNCLGFSWIGLRYSASASATVGSNLDGSDSYWTVTVSTQVWVSKASYLYCGPGTLYGVIDGSRVEAGSTGSMNGYSTSYPSSMISVSKRIPYSSSKRSVSIGAYLRFGTTVNLSGSNYSEMSAGSTTLTLPTITLPKNVTTTTGDNITGSGTSSTTYTEIISTGQGGLNYANTVPGSARLACYYGAKCVTVYGYESDRRVFVTDGSNTDTFSGLTQDGTSSIYYFPDDNYRVLGEDTEILGYAHKDGYLLTFKRGDDSVYVRYGTSLNGATQFPSSVVTRNLQVLSRPIQINDEVMVITRNGIESIAYSSQEVKANLRSYFINNYFQLSADYNYDKMTWFVEDNLLHIFLGNYEFTCDLIAKSYVREGTEASGGRYSSTLQYQYEWFVGIIPNINNELPPMMSIYQPRDFERADSTVVYENNRAIGFNNTGIFELSYTDYKVDKFMKIVGDNVEMVCIPIKAYWITPFLNMGAINVAKTIKYVYINTRSKNGDMFDVGYIDENGYQETMDKYYSTINDYKTKHKNTTIPFPKLIQIKSKIRKFMNVKLYIQNRAAMENVDNIDINDQSLYGNTTFDRILIQYQVAGKYRGE